MRALAAIVIACALVVMMVMTRAPAGPIPSLVPPLPEAVEQAQMKGKGGKAKKGKWGKAKGKKSKGPKGKSKGGPAQACTEKCAHKCASKPFACRVTCMRNC